MSYILDALRRADAERERGHVPGLHAQGTSAGVTAVARPAWRAGLTGLGAGGALVVLGLGVWHGWPTEGAASVPAVRADAPTTVIAAPPTAPEPLQTAPVPAAAVPATAGPVARAVLSAPAPAFAQAPVQAPVQAPLQAPASRKRGAPAAATPEAPRTAAGTLPATLVATAAASAPAAPAVSTLAELPDDIRRQLPALAVGGSAYSTSAASRFVIVNGQLFHEGDALAPGLVLEQIRLKSAVLAFKGYRYGINF